MVSNPLQYVVSSLNVTVSDYKTSIRYPVIAAPLVAGVVQIILTYVFTMVVVMAAIVDGIDDGIIVVIVEKGPHPKEFCALS